MDSDSVQVSSFRQWEIIKEQLNLRVLFSDNLVSFVADAKVMKNWVHFSQITVEKIKSSLKGINTEKIKQEGTLQNAGKLTLKI